LLKEIVIGIQSWSEAHRFISQHKLWKWVVVPGIIYTILFITALYFSGKSATAVTEYFTHILELSSWIQKFQNSLMGFLFTFAGIILWLTLLLFYFSFFKYLCLIIGLPVFAYLTRKTVSILENNEPNPGWSGIRKDINRGFWVALKNCGLQTIYLAGLIFLCLVPVAGWITPLIALMIEFHYHGFSMLDYGFARKKFSVAESRKFISRHKGLAISNGILFYMMHAAIVFAPSYAIVAATLTVHKVKNS
jgi:CysZ protein